MALDETILPSAKSLLACLCATLNSNPNPPAYCQLRVGLDPVAADFDQYEDYCCSGIAYVRVVRRFPAGANFPERDELPSNCAPTAWGADLNMGVFRCMPTGRDSMDPDAWDAAFTQVQHDQQAMADAICCWIQEQQLNNPYWMNFMIRDWFPFSLQGGCSGGEFQLVAQYEACPPCNDESKGFGLELFGLSSFGG